ncbi:MAG TPA: DUF2946 domain-containing protein [Castellaniella sp.]|nr:DUF2946 domain-containing protein [Castellaniella sp.]
MAISGYGKRVAAWLGMVAMLLILCAPTISHLAAAARSIPMPVCTEPGMAQPSVAIEVSSHDPSDSRSGSHLLDDCGYCSLMLHEAALPSVPPAPPSPLWLLLPVLLLPALRRFTPIGAFPSGRPRAPPAFS